MQFRMKRLFGVAAALLTLLIMTGLTACSRPEPPLPTLAIPASVEEAVGEADSVVEPAEEMMAEAEEMAEVVEEMRKEMAGRMDQVEAEMEEVVAAAKAAAEQAAAEAMKGGMTSGAEGMTGGTTSSGMAGDETMEFGDWGQNGLDFDLGPKELTAANGGFPQWWGEPVLPGDFLDSFRHRFGLYMYLMPDDADWDSAAADYSHESVPPGAVPMFGMGTEGEQAGSALECRQSGNFFGVDAAVGQVAVREVETESGLLDELDGLLEDTSPAEVDLEWVIEVHEATRAADSLFVEIIDHDVPDYLEDDYGHMYLALLDIVKFLGVSVDRALAAGLEVGPSGRSLLAMTPEERARFRVLIMESRYYLAASKELLDEQVQQVGSVAGQMTFR